MKQYDKIRRRKDVPEMPDVDLEITEKIDGSNGRFTIDNGGFIWGTRNTESTDFHKLSAPYNKMYEQIGMLFFSKGDVMLPMIEGLLNELVIFGEVSGRMNRHKLDYPWDLKFVVFDAWDKKEEKYVSISDPRVSVICHSLDLDRVPILPFSSFDDANEWVLKQDKFKMEGVVFKHYQTQTRCKSYVPGNEEIESAKHRKETNYVESKLIHRYVTRARVEKILMKIMEGQSPRSFMSYIPSMLKLMWNDICFECLPEFISEESISVTSLEVKCEKCGEIVFTPQKFERIDIGYIKKEFPKVAVGIMKEIGAER
jgi:hypothetical protein